jgi:hypothetical protein
VKMAEVVSRIGRLFHRPLDKPDGQVSAEVERSLTELHKSIDRADRVARVVQYRASREEKRIEPLIIATNEAAETLHRVWSQRR